MLLDTYREMSDTFWMVIALVTTTQVVAPMDAPQDEIFLDADAFADAEHEHDTDDILGLDEYDQFYFDNFY